MGADGGTNKEPCPRVQEKWSESPAQFIPHLEGGEKKDRRRTFECVSPKKKIGKKRPFLSAIKGKSAPFSDA